MVARKAPMKKRKKPVLQHKPRRQANPGKAARLRNLELFAKKGKTRGQRISAIYEIGKVSRTPELQREACRIFRDIIKVEKDPEILRYVAQAIVGIHYGKGAELLLQIIRKHSAEHERPLRTIAFDGIGSLAGVMDKEQIRSIYSQLEEIKKSYKPGSVDCVHIDKALKKLRARMEL
ncbi:MAG: hypothetical protein J7L44_02755 [Candidatus Diapherotrites archaeon]|nr:hypothetical protein [Candidatus Diapherotrites archaeon]